MLLSPPNMELGALVRSPAVKGVVELQAASHGLGHLLRGDPDIVKLLQLRNILQNCPPIEISVTLSTGILLQPEVLQSGKISEVTNLADVWDTVLAYVELLEVCTILDV